MQAVAVVLQLNVGDEVLVKIRQGNLKDSSSELYTQFVGMLLHSKIIFNASRRRFDQNKKGVGGILDYSDIDVNVGNGMDASSGNFTAPVSGKYFFYFQCQQYHGEFSPLYIRHNGALVATTKGQVRSQMNCCVFT